MEPHQFVGLVHSIRETPDVVSDLGSIYGALDEITRTRVHWMLHRPERLLQKQVLQGVEAVTHTSYASIDDIRGICMDKSTITFATLFDTYCLVLQIPPKGAERAPVLAAGVEQLMTTCTLDMFKTILNHWITPFEYQPLRIDCSSFANRSLPVLPYRNAMAYQPVRKLRLVEKNFDFASCFIERLVPGERLLLVVNGPHPDNLLVLRTVQNKLRTVPMNNHIEVPSLGDYAKHFILDGIYSASQGTFTVYDIQFAEVDLTMAPYRHRRQLLEECLVSTDHVFLAERLASCEGDVVIKKPNLIYRAKRSIFKIQSCVTCVLAIVAAAGDKVFLATEQDEKFTIVGKTKYTRHNLNSLGVPRRPDFVQFNRGVGASEPDILYISSPAECVRVQVSCNAVTSGGNLRLPRVERESSSLVADSELHPSRDD